MKNSISEVLKKCRLNSGKSVKEISDLLISKGFKASEKTVYSWESGNSQPTPDALLIMCKAYGVSDILNTFGYTTSSNESATISSEEYAFIRKYRKLDKSGKTYILQVLNRELDCINNMR